MNAICFRSCTPTRRFDCNNMTTCVLLSGKAGSKPVSTDERSSYKDTYAMCSTFLPAYEHLNSVGNRSSKSPTGA